MDFQKKKRWGKGWGKQQMLGGSAYENEIIFNTSRPTFLSNGWSPMSIREHTNMKKKKPKEKT